MLRTLLFTGALLVASGAIAAPAAKFLHDAIQVTIAKAGSARSSRRAVLAHPSAASGEPWSATTAPRAFRLPLSLGG